MQIEISDELQGWLVPVSDKLELKENSPEKIREEFEKFIETLENYSY